MHETLLPALPCLCATFRRTARALTQLYEKELRPLGLRATQFTVLQTLSVTGEVTQGKLGRILAMDSTSLTRTLSIMSRQGWIGKTPGTDRREWRLRLSKAGVVQFKRALPRWERAQARLQRQLGADLWDQLTKLSNHVTNAVTD
ncbi:MAG TPA: MarR family transcriptional regulator [Terriglobales bacterium]|nr:MarR family transcriptional regulator [Terriglobales bacterium]